MTKELPQSSHTLDAVGRENRRSPSRLRLVSKPVEASGMHLEIKSVEEMRHEKGRHARILTEELRWKAETAAQQRLADSGAAMKRWHTPSDGHVAHAQFSKGEWEARLMVARVDAAREG